MLTINLIFFTVTISRSKKSLEQRMRDEHVARMMREVEERRYNYTRFL
jgi:uncharacterized protein (TIGR02413 family)